MTTIKIARNVLEELAALTREAQPALSTPRGDLFVSPTLPASAVRLKVSVDAYIDFLLSLPVGDRPSVAHLAIGVDHPEIQMVVTGALTVTEGRVFLNGKPVTII